MKAAYVVSRFPSVSETFVLRELNAVAEYPDLELSLLSLFPSTDDVVHPAAEPWIGGLERPTGMAAAAGLGWWLLRRPARLAGALAVVVRATARRPRVLWRSLVTVALAAAHARGVRERGIEHVHAHFATYPALTAWLCHRLAGVEYSFTAHAHDIFVHQAMLGRKVDEAKFVAAISEFNREFLLPFDRAGTPIEVVHCGIDPRRFPFEPGPAADPEPPLLCVAGLRESKGHEVLLHAIAGEPRLSSVRLDLVGDGPLRGHLEQLVAELGLEGRVRFLGNRTEAEVGGLLAGADVFVLPSVIARNGDMEGIPVALMEAMAAGLLTIGTRMSGIPELVRDGVTGLLAEPGDVASLREALCRAVEGDSGVDRAQARRLVEDEFSIELTARRMHDLVGL